MNYKKLMLGDPIGKIWKLYPYLFHTQRQIKNIKCQSQNYEHLEENTRKSLK